MKKVILYAVTFIIAFGILTCSACAADWFAIHPNVTDEKFFGVWDGTQWTVEPKIDYSHHPTLTEAGEYAKTGDYSTASRVMFEYFKNDKQWYPWKLDARKPGLANMIANLLFFNYTDSKSDYVTQSSVTGTQWQKIQFDVTDFVSSNRGSTGVFISPLQKADEDFLISGLNSANCPMLTVNIGGTTVRFKPSRTYSLTPETRTDNPEILKARECGMPYNEDSSKVFLIFELGELSSEPIEAAMLELYVKSYTEEELIIPLGKVTSPTTQNPAWENMVTKSYNFYGATGDEFDWSLPAGAYDVWNSALSRHNFWKPLVAEYVATGDELYAETAIKLMLDFYYDLGKSTNKYGYMGGNAPDGGGWSSALDVGNRLYTVSRLLQYLVHSEHMNADRFTEILKNFYLGAQFLRDKDQIEIIEGVDTMYTAYGPANNWATYEAQGLMAVAQSFPEYTYSEHWLDLSIRRAEWVSKECFVLEDGAVSEAGPLYSKASFAVVAEFLQFIPEGTQRRKDFEDMLVKWGGYVGMQAMSPAGEDIRYGDSPGAGGTGSDDRKTLRNILDYARDEELLYFYSYGEEGTIPKEDSKYFPIRKQAFLRTGWDKDDLYLFINNDYGVGGHGQPDDLHITAAAFGDTLLIDAGTEGYGTTEREEYIRFSPDAHNTVSINDTAQKFSDQMIDDSANTTHFFTTQKEFDFWQGDTYGNKGGFIHNRAVTFVRPSYWIVSDIIDPMDTTAINNYKQNWHSSEDFTVRGHSGTASVSGSKIQIVQSDTDDMVTETNYGWTFISQYEYLRYMRSVKNVAGRATFDTVLYPSRNTDTTKVSAEKINLGSDATASIITFNDGRNVWHDYYYLNYLTEGDNYPTGIFDKYTFDGKVAVCENDTAGQTVAVNFAYGTTVTENGRELVKTDRIFENLTVEWDSNLREVKITTADDFIGSTIRIFAPGQTESVMINNTLYCAVRDGEYIVVTPY